MRRRADGRTDGSDSHQQRCEDPPSREPARGLRSLHLPVSPDVPPGASPEQTRLHRTSQRARRIPFFSVPPAGSVNTPVAARRFINPDTLVRVPRRRTTEHQTNDSHLAAISWFDICLQRVRRLFEDAVPRSRRRRNPACTCRRHMKSLYSWSCCLPSVLWGALLK